MNEYKSFLIAAVGVLLSFLSFYTMPAGIVFIVILISFILGIRSFIVHTRIMNKKLFKLDEDSNKTKEND